MTKKRNEKKLSEKVSEPYDEREEGRTPLDHFEDQKFVDDIPLKDLNIETDQEQNKHKTQDRSQSEGKYQADFKKDKN